MPAPGGDRGTKPDKVEVFCRRLCGDKKRRMVDILSGTAVLGWLGGRPGGFGGLSSFDLLSQVSSDLESRKCFAESSDLIDSHRGIGVVF